MRLVFVLEKACPEVIATVGLVTLDNVWVTTQWSESKNLDAGRHEVIFDFDASLSSLKLQIGFGLSSRLAIMHHQHVTPTSDTRALKTRQLLI